MAEQQNDPPACPPFDACPRCAYSLRGLPADHYCPECGLRFDRDCVLYRVTNPKLFLLLWALILGGGLVNLRYLRYWSSWSSETVYNKVFAVMGLVYLVCLTFGVFWARKKYKSGQKVAITADGVFLQMGAIDDGLIPWSHIRRANTGKRGRHYIAVITRRDPNRIITLGEYYTFFPAEQDAQRFVNQIRNRIAS
ncbi:MAG: hypothetical protein JSU68_14975 [Phycisphaerales bacterium]|nr:MAG: hypothetical protein JSU68_14975 [Phycisphaerales bacterium]